MEKQNKKSVTRKFILSFLSVLLITFCLLSVSIYFSSRKYIHDNAFSSAHNISITIIRTLERRIKSMEQLPQTLYSLLAPYDTLQLRTLPPKILASYPYLDECFIQYNVSGSPVCFCAARIAFDSVSCSTKTELLRSDSILAFRKNARKGLWYFTDRRQKRNICYITPLSDKPTGIHCVLGITFATEKIVDFIPDIRLFNSGYVFLTDSEGNFITPSTYSLSDNISNHLPSPEQSKIRKAFLQGRTGTGTLLKDKRKQFLFFTPIPHLNWRIGIVCPYDEILITSNKFYGLILIICAIAMFFLIVATFWIADRISRPLKLFTGYAQKIKSGQLDPGNVPVQSDDEFGELRDAFRYLQQNMNSYAEKLKMSTVKNERIQMEIRLAQKLQQRFLPRPVKLPGNIELKGELRQSKSVGGDLYEYFLIDNRLYFAIGDVSGKGIPAALYMASVVKLFRYVASRQSSTAAICNTINTYMCDSADDDMYVTMFVGIMDVNDGSITYTNAGHPEPLIVHPNRQISSLRSSSDSPIGIFENYTFHEYHYTLEKGAQIVLYTDGITDAENKYSQFYGKNKLIDSIHRASSLHPEDVIASILHDLQQYTTDAGLSDDFTVLSVFYKK